MKKRQRIEVVCGVIQTSDELLFCCKRPQGGSLAGYWEFPGGKVEQVETHQDALVRELWEELGVAVEVSDFIRSVEWPDEDKMIVLHAYRCRIGRQKIILHEHDEGRWVDESEAKRLLWAPADVPILHCLFPGAFGESY